MTDNSAEIRRLNDSFRQGLMGGRVIFTGALASPGAESLILQHQVLAAVRIAEVEEGNDPYGEADFGSVTVKDEKFFWKIDYYDLAMENGSDDPSDSKVTTRVLSIFHAEDY